MLRRIYLIAAFVAVVLNAQWATAYNPKVLAEFEELEWQAPTTMDGRLYRYRLFVPEDLRRGKETAPAENGNGRQWPLIVWLHGYGDRGENNKGQLRWLDRLLESAQGSPPVFILATQHRSDHRNWYSPTIPQEQDGLSMTMHILDELLIKYPIDSDRIYLTGLCSGGDACWELVRREPKRFAAVVPQASPGSGDPGQAKTFQEIPVWAFHCRNDELSTGGGTRAMIRAIQLAGGKAQFTMTPPNMLNDHDSWTSSFRDYHLLEWMLAQSRGAGGGYWPPGGERPWAWWQLPAWGGVIALIAMVFWIERCRWQQLSMRA
jgi:predicted peptidase